jgi:hypothetical protein
MAKQELCKYCYLHPNNYIAMHHSFTQLPDNNFKTRAHDARSPYNTNSYFDYSTPVTEPIQKIILFGIVYKDPTAAKAKP